MPSLTDEMPPGCSVDAFRHAFGRAFDSPSGFVIILAHWSPRRNQITAANLCHSRSRVTEHKISSDVIYQSVAHKIERNFLVEIILTFFQFGQSAFASVSNVRMSQNRHDFEFDIDGHKPQPKSPNSSRIFHKFM
jgi:hypothetical protein